MVPDMMSSKDARVRFSVGGKKTLIDGPFAESKELVAGYWLIQVTSLEEAIEWGEAISVFAEPFEPGDRNRSTRVY